MPRLTLTTRDNPGDDWQRIVRRLRNPARADVQPVERAIREQFSRNFRRQGSATGSWAPLAPSTVAQRLAQGFPGSRPILVRTGVFRGSYIRSGDSDAYYEFSQTAEGWEMYVGSDAGIARWHEFGTSRMPARPVTPLGGAQENAVLDAIDAMLQAIVRQEVARG